jgi:THUMP domain-like
MNSNSSDEIEWLLSGAAEPWLARVAQDLSLHSITPKWIQKLRLDLGMERTSLVIEIVQLRQRAREKFSAADKLFFTSKGLEQATDEVLARYKATRFAKNGSLFDVCCGIGGDAMGLAQRSDVRLVDRDAVALGFAQRNVESTGGCSHPFAGDANDLAFDSQVQWHIDPDRRATGERTSEIEMGEPSRATLEKMLQAAPQGAIKLAPAAKIPDSWQACCEAEWIETRSECRQLMAWFGSLARSTQVHTATILDRSGVATSFHGSPTDVATTASELETYCYDPAACLRAAKLVAAWCNLHDMRLVSEQSLYLTSSQLISSPLVAVFQLHDVLPLDVPQLKAYFRQRNIGRLEIKPRGVGITPEQLRPQLKLRGENEAVLLLTEFAGRYRAIICQRVSSERANV